MPKIISIASLVISLAAAPAAFAGGSGACQFHGNAPVKESIVTGCANQQKDALVNSGKIEATWKAVKPDKAETVDGKSTKEWKFTFRDSAEKDASKQTPHMFYTPLATLLPRT